MNCPLAVWMLKGASLECYCRTLYMVVWETQQKGKITMCDAQEQEQARIAAEAEAEANDTPELVSLSETPVPKTESLRCAPLASGVPTLTARPGVDPEFYLPGQLEHPAVAGLMLSLDERLYGAALEFVCADGTIRLETLDEKRFRIKWKKPIALAQPTSPAFDEETQSFGLLSSGTKKAMRTNPTEYL